MAAAAAAPDGVSLPLPPTQNPLLAASLKHQQQQQQQQGAAETANPLAQPAPTFASIIEQDVPTIYFQVARAKYTDFHNSVLQSILAARLHVDILTSESGYMSVHRQSAYVAMEADMLERGALAAAGGSGSSGGGGGGGAPMAPPGVGPVFVRITATEARLLEEAERADFPLPLNPEVLRRVDVERNRHERYPDGSGERLGADRLAIPHKFGASGVMQPGVDHGMDPYAYHYAPYLYRKQLPEATKSALFAAGYNEGMRREDPAQARVLFAYRGVDGVGLLSDMACLKLIVSVLTAPNSPDDEGEWQGANFDLAQLTASGKVEAIFAGHSYGAREAVIEASTASRAP